MAYSTELQKRQADEYVIASFLCCPDDGLDRPALPVLPAPHLAPRAALHRNGDRARAAAWGRAAPPRLRSFGASGGIAAGRQRSGDARARRAPGRAVGLRRDQPELRLSVGARPDRQLRRVPDGRSRAGRRLREGDARCGHDSRDGQAPDRLGQRRRLRLRPRLRRRGFGGRLRRVHRACAQCGAQGPVAEGEPRSAAVALRRRAPAEARISAPDDRAERRAHHMAGHRA